jgi:hypothetical protein
MNAEEIRKHWNIQGKYPPELISDHMLVEIAAQLAEMNQHLAELNKNFEYPLIKIEHCNEVPKP